jgi:hypothetical protein
MSLEKAIRDMLAPKQIVEAVDPDDKGEYDNEGEMAKTQLQTMIDAAEQLRGMLKDDENMPEWVQNKITKAVDYIDSARDYMKSKGDDGKAPVGEEVEESLDEESDLEEGTWALPETPKSKAALKALMKKPIKLGKNGDDASKKLYSLVGDDEVFDDLFVAGKKNPNGDARDVVKKHAKRLGLKFEELELEEMEEIVEAVMEEDKEILAALDDNAISLDDVVRSIVFEKKLDKVDPKAVKKDFKDRKDKDIDNDGDVDDSDEYLHKRRQAVSKATKKESDDENGDKEDNSDTDDNGVLKKKKKKDGEGNKGGEPIDTAPTMDESEEKMTDADMKKREEIVKELKKKTQYFKDKYGERWKDVMYATATKMAMKD